jgi:hypothetical protein
MKKRALFITFKKYNSVLDGGGIANQRNLSMAQQILGAENVKAIYIHDERKKRSFLNLLASAICFPFGYFNGLLPFKVNKIVKEAQHYDYVFISTSIFGILAKKLKSNRYKGTIIAHFHNIESIYYDSLLSRKLPIRNIVIECAAKNDGYCCKYADKVLTLNKRDDDILVKLYGRGADMLVPIALQDKCMSYNFDKKSMTGKRPQCLFLGSYFTANVEGIMWFVKNVLPHVDIELKIVGRGMAKLKEDDSCFQNVDIVSDAPDLAPFFLAADFMIFPIFSGSGMKVKTCESLMYGKNILGTDEAFEGYEIDTKRVGARCNTAEDFIQCIQKFSASPIPRYNSYSRDVYVESYSEKSSLETFRKVFD